MVSQTVKVMLISTCISIGLIMFSVLSKNIGVFGNAIILSTFILVSPLFFFRYQKFRRLKDMEVKFPSFLRDLTESIRSGIPFHKAIQDASKLNYGELSKEIRKMANQISWGMNLDKVLDQFANRVKKSKRLFTSIKIIRESYLTGGDVVSTLESVADNSNILEESEKEKKSILSQYVLLMYAISIIFIVIVVAIHKFLTPVFQATMGQTGAAVGLVNPCEAYVGVESCVDFNCMICKLFQGTSAVISPPPKCEGLSQNECINTKGCEWDTSMNLCNSITSGVSSYYLGLFFYMAIIQALFAGLVAGELSENSIAAGIKHSLILVGIDIGSFSILVQLGILGV